MRSVKGWMMAALLAVGASQAAVVLLSKIARR